MRICVCSKNTHTTQHTHTHTQNVWQMTGKKKIKKEKDKPFGVQAPQTVLLQPQHVNCWLVSLCPCRPAARWRDAVLTGHRFAGPGEQTPEQRKRREGRRERERVCVCVYVRGSDVKAHQPNKIIEVTTK